MRRTIYLLCAIALFGACSQEEFQNENLQNSKEVVFTTSFENCNTRTYINESNQLRWNADDRITIFNGNTLNQQYKFAGETGDNGGTFSIVSSDFGTGNDLSCHYAIYPYDSNNKISDEGIITTTLPATQSYVEKSFGLGANTMVAATQNTDDTFLAFKNVGGYLKLSLYGTDVTVKSITLKGNNGEKIAGKATITHSYGNNPSVTMAEEATDEITLDCGAGVTVGSTAQTATDFWIVVPPTTFAGGFTITITDKYNGVFNKITTKQFLIERNSIHPMIAVELSNFIPATEYFLDEAGTLLSSVDPKVKNSLTTMKIHGPLNASDIDFIQEIGGTNGNLAELDLTEASIESGGGYYNDDYQTYNDIIGQKMFVNCSKLTTLLLPKGITQIRQNAFSGCERLNKLVIYDKLSSIQSGAFNNIYSLKTVEIDSNNENFCIIDGIIYDKAITTLIYCPRGLEAVNITIPSTVTALWEGCFQSTTGITGRITVPGSVSSLSKYCFKLSKVKEIVLKEGVTSLNNECFASCWNLTTVTLPSTINNQNSADGAFAGCTSLSDLYIYKEEPGLGLTLSYSKDFINTGEFTLHVPAGCADSYKACEYWSKVKDRIVEMN